jgi:hypothetical protein
VAGRRFDIHPPSLLFVFHKGEKRKAAKSGRSVLMLRFGEYLLHADACARRAAYFDFSYRCFWFCWFVGKPK